MSIFLRVYRILNVFLVIISVFRGTTTTVSTTVPCSDYEMLIINTKHCVSRCPIRCINDVCFEDGICPCAGFYETSFERGLICAFECQIGCNSADGYCASTDLCVCPKGLVYDALARRCRKYVLLTDRCRGQCFYGRCTGSGECVCAQGYRITSAFFGQLCTPVCKQDCAPHGYCRLPNMCACRKKHHHYERDGRCHKW